MNKDDLAHIAEILSISEEDQEKMATLAIIDYLKQELDKLRQEILDS